MTLRTARSCSALGAALVLAAAPSPLSLPAGAQELQAPSPALEAPFFAWEEGDYIRALEGYLAALLAPGGERHLREIALRTGEWYRVTEVAPDGTAPAFAPDGGTALVHVPGREGLLTRILDLSDPARPRVAADLDPGITSGIPPVALGTRGRVARVTVEVGPAVSAAREALSRALASGVRGGALTPLREAVARAEREAGVLRIRDGTGERAVELPGLRVGPGSALAWSPEGSVLAVGAFLADEGSGLRTELVILRAPAWRPERLEGSAGARNPRLLPGGRIVVWEATSSVEERGPDGSLLRVRSTPVLHLRETAGPRAWTLPGEGWTLSADGRTAAFLETVGDRTRLGVVALDPAGLGAVPPTPRILAEFDTRVAAPALSPDGRRVAYQRMPRDDWEIFVRATDGSGDEVQVTFEVQHDILPRFLDDRTLLALKGEPRHRRSYLYDLETGSWEKLFHNNTVRTIAPEYEWAASPDGRLLLIVADRDGDTVSPERSVHLLDRGSTLTREALVERLRAGLAEEHRLREVAEAVYGTLDHRIRPLTEAVSPARIFLHARDLHAFGSKHITRPGNALAIEYLVRTLRGWGYEPELQWFEPQPGLRTANVIAKLPGTVDPELVYIASSHFDSHVRGPGADDNSSGTTALLEAARVLRNHPQAATLHFAFFTGEESGLLGSREYVRRADAGGVRVLGALNNDMVGWANDHRLDNTIRYSNPGIRDLQHGAAIRYSGLITYEARYYRNTDAAAFYEAWGDIVGGIGSYPVLGNPNYHQFGDRLETIHHGLVAEVARTTVATLVALASSPARPTGLREVERRGWQVELAWDPAPESGVVGYIVQIARPGHAAERIRVVEPRIRLGGVEAGTVVEVRAVGGDGRESWDGARRILP